MKRTRFTIGAREAGWAGTKVGTDQVKTLSTILAGQ